MKNVVLAIALFGIAVRAQAPCSGITCLLNCPLDSRCPPTNPAKPVLLPGPYCTKFLKCHDGRACPFDCPVGLHFNNAKQTCDWPEQACCDPSVPCRPSDPCNGGGCNPGQPPSPTWPPPTPSPVWPPPSPSPQDPPCSGVICLLNCPVDSRCPPTNPAKPVLLPGPYCSKFLKCHDGRACPFDCPVGLHFNNAKQTCDWPEQACCDPSVPCRPSDPCNGGGCNPGQPPSPTWPPSTPSPIWPPPSPSPQDPPCSGITCLINCPVDSRCPSTNPAKPVLLPGPYCTKFLKCHDGRACPFDCPAGLHFNNAKQACDWPEQACCDPSVPCRPSDPCNGGGCNPGQPPSPVWPPSTPSPIWPPPSPSPQDPPCSGVICLLNCPVDSRCPSTNPAKPVLLPGPYCTKFLKCHDGRACPFDCPAGLHFNNAKQACDWPEQACCDPSVPCRPSDPCNGGGCNPGQPPSPVWPPSTPSPVWPPPSPSPQDPPCSGVICLLNCPVDSRCPPTNPAKPVLLPGPYCSKFLKCHDGRACPFDCPIGLHFNSAKQICDWPEQACCDPSVPCRPADPCNGGGCNPGQPPQPPSPTWPPPSPSPQDPPCNDVTCNKNCYRNTQCPAVNPVKPLLIRHNNCAKYYKCESGFACEMNCPPGLHFNNAKQICDWPEQACCDPSVPCRPADPCNGGGCNPIPPPQPPSPTWPPPSPSPQDPPCNDVTCKSNCFPNSQCPTSNPAKPLLLRHNNCSKYYKCESGFACEMSCPPGLHLNVGKQVCDWPEQACCDPSVPCRPADPCVGFGCNQMQPPFFHRY